MLDEAIEALNKAVILNPDAANAHYQLGIAYRRKGNTAEAAGAFFDAGLLAVVKDNKDLAVNAYINLKEMGNLQLAGELQGVLSPWFDPATEAIKPSAGGRYSNRHDAVIDVRRVSVAVTVQTGMRS